MDLASYFQVDWELTFANLILLGIAFILSLPVALNRERNSRSAGLRTYPLVALAACGLMLIGISVLEDSASHSRIAQGIITGMGFIGGGAILKSKGNVTGLATAASLWATGALGIAVAWQRFEIAVVLSVLMFAALSLGSEAKKHIDKSRQDDRPEGRQDDQ